MPSFEMVLAQMLENLKLNIKYQPLFLGGVASVSGGAGGPPGGFIGYLPQNRVAYDTAEVADNGISVSGTLLDNLNHIRYRIQALEGGVSGVFSVLDNGILVSDSVDALDFDDTLSVTLSGSTAVITGVAGSGTGASNFLELTDTPSDYTDQAGKYVTVNETADGLTFTDAPTASGGVTDHTLLDNLNTTDYYHLSQADHTDLTNGEDTTLHIHDTRYYTESEVNDLIVTVSGIAVQEVGSAAIPGITNLLIAGATVSDEGSGSAKITIAISGNVIPYLFGNATVPLLSSFDWINQGDAVATQYDTCITVTIPVAAENSAHLLVKELPATTNYQITIGMNPAMLTSFHRAGIALIDTVGSGIIMGGVLGSDLNLFSSVLRWTDYETWNDVINSSWNCTTKPTYYRIKNDGTYNTYYWSLDGVLWFQYYQEAYDAYIVADSYGIVISPDNDTYPMGITVFHFLCETL